MIGFEECRLTEAPKEKGFKGDVKIPSFNEWEDGENETVNEINGKKESIRKKKTSK